VLILPNLKSFGINLPFAVHWNPFEAKNINILTKNYIFSIFERLKVVISPNLRLFSINIPSAVPWNPYGTK